MTAKRKTRTIEERLKELEEKEQKLNQQKAKLLEQKKEEQAKIDEKKIAIIFKSFKKNISNWDNLSEDEITLLCDELFTKFGKEINSII